MGWNPNFNFSLRDDEITFCNLIFDKNCAEYLCEELLRIKQGGEVAPEYLVQLLSKGCFTDEELTKTKADYEQVLADIAELKKCVHMDKSMAAWIGGLDTKASYIVGSKTWYQKYTDMKTMAAELYNNALMSGYQFTPEQRQFYDARYTEILRATNASERTELAIRRQYEQNKIDGNEDADMIYLESMHSAGLLSDEAFASKSLLFSASNASKVEVTMKPLAEDEVMFDYGLISGLWSIVADSPNINEAYGIFYERVLKVLLGAPEYIRRYVAGIESLSGLYAQNRVSAEEMVLITADCIQSMNNENFSSDIRKADIRWKKEQKDEVASLLEECSATGTQSSSDMVEFDAACMNKLASRIRSIEDTQLRAEASAKFILKVVEVLKEAEIVVNFKWERKSNEFLSGGEATAEDVIAQLDKCMECVTFSANYPLINALDYEVSKDWINSLGISLE